AVPRAHDADARGEVEVATPVGAVDVAAARVVDDHRGGLQETGGQRRHRNLRGGLLDCRQYFYDVTDGKGGAHEPGDGRDRDGAQGPVHRWPVDAGATDHAGGGPVDGRGALRG